MSKFLFTSESVTEGHPDKACDAFSDAILDEILSKDNGAHVACESLATKGLVVISGEVRTTASIDVDRIVKDTIRTIGYDKSNSGIDPEDVEVLSKLHEQSPEIAQGVDSDDVAEQGPFRVNDRAGVSVRARISGVAHQRIGGIQLSSRIGKPAHVCYVRMDHGVDMSSAHICIGIRA